MVVKRIFGKLYRTFYYLHNRPLYGLLGKNSIIKKPLSIVNKKGIFIGNNVRIMPFARIEAITNWYSNGERILLNPKLIIEDGCDIGQGAHITAAECVHIHKNVLIAPYVYITDVMHDYEDISKPVTKQGINFKPTEIGEDSFLGIGVKVLEGVKIGKHCVVLANSVVTHDVPDYCVVTGNPAKILKKYSKETGKWEKVK